MHRKLTLLMALLALLAMSPSALAQNVAKLGVVDLQRALQEVNEGKKAKETLAKLKTTYESELEKRKKEFEEMQESLKAQEMMLSDEAKQQKMGELQSKAIELQQVMTTAQQDMMDQEAKLSGPIIDKLANVTRKIAAEGGYNMVIDATYVFYLNGVTDITDQVIARYNDKK